MQFYFLPFVIVNSDKQKNQIQKGTDRNKYMDIIGDVRGVGRIGRLGLICIYYWWDSQVAQLGKESTCLCRRNRRYWVQSLGWEDSLEEEMATHSSVFAWKIPWTEEPGGLQPIGSQRVRQDWICMHQCNTVDTMYKIYTNENILHSTGNCT